MRKEKFADSKISENSVDGALIVFCGSSGYPVQLSERPKNAWLKVDVTLQTTLSFVQYDTNVQLNIVLKFL